jgi:RNA polymerase sigma-70 factor, ECF subfamily
MQSPDPATIRSAAAGDLVAFTSIVRACQPHVWRFVRHLVGDDELATDLTQETFVRVHRSLATFRHDADFVTWLLRIARNLTIDEHRRASRRVPIRPLDDATSIADPGPEPGFQAELHAALATLTVEQREAILLVEVAGLRYREAAEVLDVAEGTVKSRVFSARASLVRWLASDDDREPQHG